MAEAMKIRAQLSGEQAIVRVLMKHVMESGQRRDPQGRAIPAWHITEVSATLNGRLVMTTHWGPSVARNPFLQFTLRRARAGDRVAITWRDDHGDSRTDEAVVA